jgi:hypothetical protein
MFAFVIKIAYFSVGILKNGAAEDNRPGKITICLQKYEYSIIH